MTISEAMKSIIISNNNFTIGYPRDEFDGSVTVTANPEVFGDSYGLAWLSSKKAKCNGYLFAVMH